MKCEVNPGRRVHGKLGRPGRDCSVQAGWGLRAGPGISLGAQRQLHTFAIFIVLNFERGEELETALLSLHILWED